jgi:hypothetical protein
MTYINQIDFNKSNEIQELHFGKNITNANQN